MREHMGIPTDHKVGELVYDRIRNDLGVITKIIHKPLYECWVDWCKGLPKAYNYYSITVYKKILQESLENKNEHRTQNR
jgi:hypothetical protein